MRENLTEFPIRNLLIRGRKCEIGATDFKVQQIRRLAEKADWVVFIDDSVHFCNEVLKACPKNVLVVNIPLGKTKNPMVHERLLVVGRYPVESQAIYPLWRMFKEAI
jgi:hypothetical protein